MAKSERPPKQLDVDCPKCGENVRMEQGSLLFIRLMAVIFTVAAIALCILGVNVIRIALCILGVNEIRGVVEGTVGGLFLLAMCAGAAFIAIRLWMPASMLTAMWHGTCNACNSTVQAQYKKEDDGFRQVTTLLKEGADQPSEASAAGKVLSENTAEKPVVQKIEVEFTPEKTRLYDSTDELRDAILRGEVNKTFKARMVQYDDGKPKPDENWRKVEKIALADAKLRSLYRPVWGYTLRFLGYGALAGIALKSIDTTVTMFALNPEIGILWLLLIGAHILSVKWGPSIPLAWGGLLLLSFGEGMPNLCFMFFAAGLSTALVGCIFGAPAGMIVGTVVGHLKRKRTPKAPDAGPEGAKPYLVGIILPLGALLVLIPIYLWFNTMILDWLQQ